MFLTYLESDFEKVPIGRNVQLFKLYNFVKRFHTKIVHKYEFHLNLYGSPNVDRGTFIAWGNRNSYLHTFSPQVPLDKFA